MGILLAMVSALLVLGVAVPLGHAAEFPYCPAGQAPAFVFGFKALKDALGERMGQPLECEHANPDNGDTLQQTSTGLSFYRKSTNTPTFTNGFEHWGLTEAGLVYWTGDSIDPPPSAVAVSPPAQPTSEAVRVEDYRFQPLVLTVSPGTTVVWTNFDDVEHTVTADDESYDSGLMLLGDTFTQRFEQPGVYGYYCVVHGSPGSGQFGTIVVSGS